MIRRSSGPLPTASLHSFSFRHFARGFATASQHGRVTHFVEWKLKLLWVSLAACASALLLSITNYISQNIAAVPFIWIIPLSLYLLTFIVCFEGQRWYKRRFFLRFFALGLAAMAYVLGVNRGSPRPFLHVCVFCIGLFACCMVCHGELARLKPRS